MSDFDASKIRLVASAAALVVALGMTACGGSDDGDGGGGGDNAATASTSASTSTTQSATSLAADKREITATMRTFKGRFNSTDGPGFCARLSKAGKQEVVTAIANSAYARAIKSRKCAGIITTYSREIRRMGNGYRPVEVRKITINGDRARVISKGGLAGRRTVARFDLIREDGTWKVEDPSTGGQDRIRVEKTETTE